MMSGNNKPEMPLDLDAMFAEARKAQPKPSDRLMDAVLRDAEQAMPQPAVPAAAVAPNLWSRISDALGSLGGWQGVGALTACACFGLWVGYSTPDSVSVFGADYSLTTDVADAEYSLYSDIDDLLQEG